MGTLGGNLCLENRCFYYNQTHSYQFVEPCFKRNGDKCYLIPGSEKCRAVFQADTAPALISLGALVNIKGAESARRLPLEELYTGDALRPLAVSGSEVITEVIIPQQAPVGGSAFVKFSMRGGVEFAALNIAVVLDAEDDGILCRGARITVGAISAAPARIITAEEAMKGQPLSEELFDRTARIAASEVRPFPHHGYSAAYIRECLHIQCRQALKLASQRVRSH
jgi:CO/xanthine dehydrogenase FAD-binding subunit